MLIIINMINSGPGSSSDVPSSDVLGDWWLWIVIAVTAVLTITILTGITCVLIMRVIY